MRPLHMSCIGDTNLETMWTASVDVAIAMPLYNESDGITETVSSLDRELSKAGLRYVLCVQDDCSTDNSVEKVRALSKLIQGELRVESNEKNLRHGPTTHRAYQRSLDTGAALICQIDSDGEFFPEDLVKLLSSSGQHGLIIGARHKRQSPWFRRVVTAGLRVLLVFRFGVFSRDPNSPIRVFNATALAELLRSVSANSPIPNVQLTILAHRRGLRVKYARVNHRPRRGAVEEGTMWQSGKSERARVPKSFVRFCLGALAEFWRTPKHKSE